MSFVTDEGLGEDTSEVDYNHENYGEKCGICMDVVIDRGIIDCCQHWFCFACIDDWGAITNLCPLCQNVFQLITCVPVYDTIGNNVDDEELLPGDDDWSIEGSSSTLSFPSYYIDENAVACLDGIECKIRSCFQNVTKDCDLDTSIVCDTCNIWYHAYCVDFDPKGSHEDTWDCPRCKEPDACLVSNPFNSFTMESSLDLSDRMASCGNLYVSIADAGETALVVSLVETDESHDHLNNDSTTDMSKYLCSSDAIKKRSGEALKEKLNISSDQISDTYGNSSCLDPRNSGPGTSSVEAENASTSLGNKVGASFGNDKSVPGDTPIELCNSVRNIRQATTGNLNGEDKALAHLSAGNAVNCTSEVIVSKELKIKHKDEKDDLKTDLMSIVRGTGRRPSAKPLSNEKRVDDTQNKVGLRVKKIMRRSSNEAESSMVLQKLRKEIKDVVRNKSADIEGHTFDPELLSAFRAAIASSSLNHDRKLPSSAIKFKKNLLQKGGIRENLTKKIYGNSNGKRKRAWDRECEVEFWKHRCMKATVPEKVSTLNSVLDLLKSNELNSEKNAVSGCPENNSILSRVYVADTSVFPRNDNIMPLSVLSASNDQNDSSGDQTKNMKTLKSGEISANDRNKKSCSGNPSSKNNIANVSKTSLGSSKANSPNEIAADNDDRKKDKRKWALEILAKKKAADNKTDDKVNQEEDATIKANFPLLVQLPREMRPHTEPCRNTKIPVPVRQRQLYRLTEHFLKKLNLPVLRRSADTELAVADAINIEKGIAERSNSKNGYLNFCSHEIMQLTNSITPEAPKSDSNILEAKDYPQDEASADPDVLDALRDAGLADSPRQSPPEDSSTAKLPDSDNILELDTNADVDIYGDFEYDLEGQDYLGAADVKIPMQSGAVEDSKLKIVLNSLNNSDKNFEESKLEETQMRCWIDDGSGNVGSNERDEDISLVECEALYGPDKEPLFKRKSYETNELGNLQTLHESSKLNDGSVVAKKVEAYVKEHIRPLCKSGVISGDQYRWAVAKTTEKVMRYHSDSKNANFLIKEGDKIKKLAEQYVETAQFKVDT